MENQTLEQIIEFYEFLINEKIPEEITLKKSHQPKLTPNQAFSVIWYLQEHFRIIDDKFEQCYTCKNIFDSKSEGYYHDAEDCDCDICKNDKRIKKMLAGKNFCSENCEPY